MADVTVSKIDEMEPIYDGLARRARATLGVTSFGMQVMTLPANWDGYPDHKHDASVADANQEEVYIPLAGSGTLQADGESYVLEPGRMLRVGPKVRGGKAFEQPVGVRLQVAVDVGCFSPLALLDQAQADVGCDSVQPGAEWCLRLEAIDAAPGAQHRLLERVVGVV